MFALYLFSLVFGGVLLLLSVLGVISEHEGEHGHFADDHPVGEFLSLRTFVYLATGFGATGVLLHLAGAPPVTGAVLALLTGLGAGALSTVLYRWLRATESGIVPTSSDHLVGLEGEVVVPVRPGALGKVRVTAGERSFELLARGHVPEAGALLRGTPIVILEVEDGTALVAPATSLLPDVL